MACALADNSARRTKAELRTDDRARRDAIPKMQREARAQQAASQALPRLSGTRIVAVYSALGSEINPSPLVIQLRRTGMICVFPRVRSADTALEFSVVAHPSELALGKFGILEPLPSLPAIDIGTIDAFVVPALSFDTAGNRLGWGKGYYDRTLAQNSHALRIGFCFHEQLRASIPTTPGDQSMDWVISDSKTIQCPSREASTGLENEV